MKSIIVLSLLAASSAFANQFSNFMGTYVPAGKSVEQSYGTTDCNSFGYSTLTKFIIYKHEGVLTFKHIGAMDYSGLLKETNYTTRRLQHTVYITGDATQASKQETFFDFIHNETSTTTITISSLKDGKFHLQLSNYVSNENRNIQTYCTSDIDVVRK